MKIVKKAISYICVFLILIGTIQISVTNAYAEDVVLQQADPRWASYPYGKSTLGPSSCGLFANLNAVSYLTGHSFSMDELHEWADYAGANYYEYGSGSYHTITKGLASKFGDEYEYKFTEYYVFSNYVSVAGSAYPSSTSAMNTIWTKLTSELSDGKVAVGLVHGHFIAIVDYDPATDKVLIYDSAADLTKRGTTTSGDWKSKNEMYYYSSEGKSNLKFRCCFTFLQSNATTGIKNISVSDISNNNATISLDIYNKLSQNISSCGFFIGQSSSNMVKVTQEVNSNAENYNTSFDISDCYHPLSPGTEYYCQGFAYIDGVYYSSSVISFNTTGNSYGSVSEPVYNQISSTSVQFSAHFENDQALPITSIGYYIGTSTEDMQLISSDADIYKSTDINFNSLRGGLTLTPSTMYYVQMYMVLYDQTYLSGMSHFRTIAAEDDIFTVSYDANGGTNAPRNQTKPYDEDLIITDNVPVREGYIFIGWSTDPNSNSIDYAASDTYTLNQDIILYAVWGVYEESDTEQPPIDTESDIDGYIMGDVNDDAEVNMKDVVLVQKVIAKLITFEDIHRNAYICADVDHTGKVNMVDVTMMQKYIAKLITLSFY